MLNRSSYEADSSAISSFKLAFSIAQIFQYNSDIYRKTGSQNSYNFDKENFLSIYIALLIHLKQKAKQSLKSYLNLVNVACIIKRYYIAVPVNSSRDGTACGNLLRTNIFNNHTIDHNSSFRIARDSFHSTALAALADGNLLVPLLLVKDNEKNI